MSYRYHPSIVLNKFTEILIGRPFTKKSFSKAVVFLIAHRFFHSRVFTLSLLELFSLSDTLWSWGSYSCFTGEFRTFWIHTFHKKECSIFFNHRFYRTDLLLHYRPFWKCPTGSIKNDAKNACTARLKLKGDFLY